MKLPSLSSFPRRLVVFRRCCQLVVQGGKKKKKKKGNENSTTKKLHLSFLFSSCAIHMTKTHKECNGEPIHQTVKSW
ncbi:unnamed protein product [Prunus armeniaca]